MAGFLRAWLWVAGQVVNGVRLLADQAIASEMVERIHAGLADNQALSNTAWASGALDAVLEAVFLMVKNRQERLLKLLLQLSLGHVLHQLGVLTVNYQSLGLVMLRGLPNVRFTLPGAETDGFAPLMSDDVRPPSAETAFLGLMGHYCQ